MVPSLPLVPLNMDSAWKLLQAVDEKPPSLQHRRGPGRAASINSIEIILLDLARKGNVILYGRGGQDLLQGGGNVLRLRLL